MRTRHGKLAGLLVAAGAVVLLVAAAGCYTQNAPYAVVGGYAIGMPPPPRPELKSIPEGPEHDACRAELNKALDRADYFEAALKDCEKERDGWKAKAPAQTP
ncbi:MAG: hypothetical protein BIFFINMI_00065 [Phycisphaerae bacterium]|nr:hypothetical protein [Phycisphaerae bacterium]